jgi:hypothetical protein
LSKRKLELIDALRTHDNALNAARAALDNHARARQYKAFAQVATEAAKVATLAQIHATELDAILEEDWKARKGQA